MKIRHMLALVVMLATSLFVANQAAAATPEEVKEVTHLMSEANWHPRVSASKEYDDGSRQMVFVARGMRYTFYRSHGEGRLHFLSVWMRPNGSSGQDVIMTFTDHGLDASADFGIGGPVATRDRMGRIFRAGDTPGGLSPEGVEHRAYWQAFYDQAISEALRRLRHPGDRHFRGKMWHQELYGQAAASGARP